MSDFTIENVEHALSTLYWSWCSGKIGLAQFIIRVKKLQERCIEKGLNKVKE